MFSTLRPCC
ncbi:unnamed protein product [Linum tenue]|uniref:Uncharacterized protein n=1 Tax=Linum tenue TaxID=586396 RepID=A0AAV0HB30_9ROSI|nr:unnamed protein product [Linum tenue]